MVKKRKKTSKKVRTTYKKKRVLTHVKAHRRHVYKKVPVRYTVRKFK